MSVRITVSGREASNRWPHIRRYLWVEPSGWVGDHYLSWYFTHERVSVPNVEMAAAYEEWADFYEFRWEQRAGELAGDPDLRGLVEEWTDDMAYCCRRCAVYARGEDPGEPVPLSVRRPDLYAAKRHGWTRSSQNWRRISRPASRSGGCARPGSRGLPRAGEKGGSEGIASGFRDDQNR